MARLKVLAEKNVPFRLRTLEVFQLRVQVEAALKGEDTLERRDLVYAPVCHSRTVAFHGSLGNRGISAQICTDGFSQSCVVVTFKAFVGSSRGAAGSRLSGGALGGFIQSPHVQCKRDPVPGCQGWCPLACHSQAHLETCHL